MNYTINKKIISLKEIQQKLPISLKSQKQVLENRTKIKRILTGKDRRKLIIVGPCSAWPFDAVIDYAKKISELARMVNDKLLIVMRVYTQKPRTKTGWLGPIIQPNPFDNSDINNGIIACRKMILKILELGLPIASEILFLRSELNFLDLYSWACIGARSSENQEHRVLSSALDIPVGLKNPTHGNLDVAVNSIIAAQNKHTMVLDDYDITSNGNQFAHLVLRGSNGMPNYQIENVDNAIQLMTKNDIKNISIVIDASHDNSIIKNVKSHLNQISVIKDILNYDDKYKFYIKGFMLESFNIEGNQKVESLTTETVNMNGLSITDPCLSWEQTENLIFDIYNTCNMEQYDFADLKSVVNI